VVAKVKERLTVSKQTMHRFKLMKLNKVQSKEQCHVEISRRFTVLEILDTEVDIN
jgi:hypothetical protein